MGCFKSSDPPNIEDMAFERAPIEEIVFITRAKPSDAQIASHLIYLAMGRVADFIFGFGSSTRAVGTLEKLFSHNGNRFSHQCARFAKTRNGDIVGMILAYPCRETIGLHVKLARQLIPIYGLLDSVLLLRNSLLMLLSVFSPGQSGVCGGDEYYISTLAVLPRFQGMGIGTMLLAYAADEAKEAGFSKCSLGVDIHNDRALRLYEYRGYKAVETVKVRCFGERIGSRGFYRMVKYL